MFGDRAKRERDLEEEIQSHLTLAEQDRIRNGETPDHAATAARREFGNMTHIKESARELWGWTWLERCKQDSLYALRQLRKSPAFTITAILSIALGIGGTTAIFTVVRAVLLKPLEYPEPERIVRLSRGATVVRFNEMKAAARSYTELGDYLGGAEDTAVSGSGAPEVLKQARVSADFLSILGIKPMLGRAFRAEEGEPGGPDVAMISAGLWRRRFGGDPFISGKTITLAARICTIAGVLPPGFQFPFPDIDVWVTKPSENIDTLSPMLAVFGRLKPGVSLAAANAELAVLKRQYAAAHPAMLDVRAGQTEEVAPLRDQVVANVRTMLWILFGAVGFVLLIVCANVAGLLLSRGAARSREFAARAALGAGRRRLLAQVLNESLLLGCAGGVLGLLIATSVIRSIAGMTVLNLPRADKIHVDEVVFGFAALISIASSVFFGIAPALNASRSDPASVLRTAGEAANAGRPRRFMGRFSVRGLLVVAQVALSIVLLAGTALLMESLARLSRMDIGFNREDLLTTRISLPLSRYDTERKRAAFQEELVRRVESLPGVTGASVTFFAPMTGIAAGMPVQDANQPRLNLNQRSFATIENVSPDYFRTLGIALKRGREFTSRDTLDRPMVAIVDERLARTLWPLSRERPAYPGGVDPVGRHILLGASPVPLEVVGVVAAMHQNLDDGPWWPGVYRPGSQSPQPSFGFIVRTSGNPTHVVNAIRKQVLAIDPDQPISGVRTMDELIEAQLGQRRLILVLLGSFAATALLLSLVGIYGVIAYSVAQRTAEIGIRRAVGAQSGDILRQVLASGLVLTLAGVGAGTVAALELTRAMKSLLFEVSPTDPLTFGAVALLFVVIAMAASYIPARRAVRIDPMHALRNG